MSRRMLPFPAARTFGLDCHRSLRRSENQHLFSQKAFSERFKKGPDPPFFHAAKETIFLELRFIVHVDKIDSMVIDMSHCLFVTGGDFNPIPFIGISYLRTGKYLAGLFKGRILCQVF